MVENYYKIFNWFRYLFNYYKKLTNKLNNNLNYGGFICTYV